MMARTCEVEIYRPPAFPRFEDLSCCFNAVSPVEAVEFGSDWEFKHRVRVGIIQQRLSRDLGISKHLGKLRLIDHSWNMISLHPITLSLLKVPLQSLEVLLVQFSGLILWEMQHLEPDPSRSLILLSPLSGQPLLPICESRRRWHLAYVVSRSELNGIFTEEGGVGERAGGCVALCGSMGAAKMCCFLIKQAHTPNNTIHAQPGHLPHELDCYDAYPSPSTPFARSSSLPT